MNSRLNSAISIRWLSLDFMKCTAKGTALDIVKKRGAQKRWLSERWVVMGAHIRQVSNILTKL